MEMTYNVSDLKRLIAESSNEFKAVLGPNVEKENKSNNGKAYSDAKKRAKDYDGGLAKEEKKVKYEKRNKRSKSSKRRCCKVCSKCPVIRT